MSRSEQPPSGGAAIPAPPCPAALRDALAAPLLAGAGSPPAEWRVSAGFVDYEVAVREMEDRVARIAAGAAPELVWLLEHPPIYTAGTSAKDADLLDPRFPVHRTGRGGQFTYHGPGQRVAYVLLDLGRRRRDARAYVCGLEAWLIGTLADFGVVGARREARVGVWVTRPDKPRGFHGETAEDKIAAIGVRLRQWVSFHGIALNVAPELAHFGGIAPCGVREGHLGVTSLADLDVGATMAEVDAALRKNFETIFGGTIDAG
jgi:lipoyl(octanoyl) transferase